VEEAGRADSVHSSPKITNIHRDRKGYLNFCLGWLQRLLKTAAAAAAKEGHERSRLPSINSVPRSNINEKNAPSDNLEPQLGVEKKHVLRAGPSPGV
jgi:hypothetical protein